MAPRRARRGSGSSNPSRQDLAENRRHDRAWLAVKAFNAQRPMLTAFARAVTGDNSVNVRAGKMTQTNGRDIFIVPPISMGDRPEHERELCNKRDPETKIMLCHACAASDLLDRRLFHEIAHIAFKSFAKVTKFHRQRMRQLVDEWHPKEACNHATSLHRQMDAEETYGGIAYVFSPFLNQLNEAFDDARVDSKMYRARPGLKQPTLAAMHSIFTRGIEKDDGKLIKWRDAPLNAQVIIGLMLVGMGIEILPGWLSDAAINHLKDPELLRISDRAHLANTVINSFDIALAAFLRLQEMGLCYVPKCVPTPSLNAEPEPNEDKDKDDDSDGCNSGGTGDGNADPSDSPESEDDKSEAGNKSGMADDDGEAQPGGEDSPGDAGDGADSGDAGGDEDQQDAGASGDDDESDEDADGSGGGDDPEAGAGDDQPDDGEVRDADGKSKPEDKSDGQDDADDAADRHSDGDGGDSPEPEAGDEAGEPGGTGEGDREDSDGEGDAKQDREGNDGAGESDHDGSDREPGEASEGPGAGGGSPAADDGADGEAEAGEDLAEADESAGDGADGGDDDIESADDGLEQAEDLEDDDDGAEARRPLGEDVWDEDNPESQVEPGLTPEERQALMGTPEEIGDLLEKFLGHGHEEEVDAELLGDPPPEEMTDERDKMAVATAVGQEAVFDTSSKTVRGVQVVQYPHPAFGWQGQGGYTTPASFMPSESIIGQNLMQARIVFSENKRAKTQGNLKSGKINTRVLGRRAALGDERLFKKRTLPGKRDYFVVITADCSGSTSSSRRNERIKRAVFAKAELLNRLGIPFAIYGHTGGEGDVNIGWWSENTDGMTEVWLMQIKGANEPWNDTTRQRLADMPPVAENLDGHTLEYMRKVAEKSTATDRIIIYYTDGAMPAANYDEELVILETEIEKCRRNNITLMAVGINTDSPERYGFDTVRVDSDEDLSAVVDRLKTRLTS